jgi:tetratricopeptide (TPR) repeat protein
VPTGEAKQYIQQAETLLKKAQTDLDAAVSGTMDLDAQSRYSSSAFQARAALAQLYLMECVNKPGEVKKVLDGVDERYGDDAEKVSMAWTFRISALEKLGKLDEAVALLDTLVKRSPESRAIGTAAGLIARALDRRAQEFDTQKKPKERDAELRRAASYYSMSGKSLAKNPGTRAGDLNVIADRLLALAYQFNEVPQKWDSFVGWQPSRSREVSLWRDAEDLYRAALVLAPSYQNQIKLGRVLGFQGNYAESASTLARLFDNEPILLFDTDGGPPKFNAKLLEQKRELFLAYLEWGVAAYEAGVQTKEAELYRRADEIFGNVVRIPAAESPVYWFAKLFQVRSLMQQGKYQDAKLVMNDIERKNSVLGEPAGLQNDFKALQTELSKKVFEKG